MLLILKNFLKSIALVPSVLALSFFGFAVLLTTIRIEYEHYTFFKALIITDAKDIQFVIAYVIGGIFTLTIFSYTMVMNVLNRNINNYSPRLIPLLLSEKHHQVILGFTSGTIVYAMVLSVALINDNSNYFPAIGAALAAIFAMVCVLLFIYFIHSVSKSIHINYILRELFNQTVKQMQKRAVEYGEKIDYNKDMPFDHELYSDTVGVLRLFSIKNVKKIVDDYGIKIQVNKRCGDFIYKDDVLLRMDKKLSDEQLNRLRALFVIDHEVAVDVHEIGFKHFVEVAVKASSPAINDPGTSKSCIDYLTQLFIYRCGLPFEGKHISLFDTRICLRQIDNSTLLVKCFVEMYRYMKDDPLLSPTLQKALLTIQNKSGHTLNLDWKKLRDYERLM
ncbi:hypothetical protein LCGC14_0666040 [marine sediment metagenome]|uniref:DUF2254 domain-containing protein n=2 Tax=root TaxID=1 RepID=A0A831QSF8_9FLAO|nr:DUF2254 domain-containing protein [Pricia sp.]HEA21847.1 DUF2254 domain-containing protein [Pricia antarctica]